MLLLLHIFAATNTKIYNTNYNYAAINNHLKHKHTKKMNTTALKFEKIVLPIATLRAMKLGESMKIYTKDIKTSTLRSTASKLKKEGYLFRVSDRALINETIVECIKTPTL